MTIDPPSELELRLRQLDVFVAEAKGILAAYDAWGETAADSDGWPLDPEEYGRRQQLRDADTWRSFERINEASLLEAATQQLNNLPTKLQHPSWKGQLIALSEATAGLRGVRADWRADREALPANAGPGTFEYDDAVAERNEEAWGYLDEWALHGRVLLDIAAAANTHRASALSLNPTLSRPTPSPRPAAPGGSTPGRGRAR